MGQDYSQHGEQLIIEQYFGLRFKGTVLDIGANDGKTLSNSLACIERGWSGVLVEPSLEAFGKMSELHADNKAVQCINFAIFDKEGEFDFYDNGTHLNKGDTALLSTLLEGELDRWKGSHNQFTKTKTKCITFKQLMKQSKYKTFDLISIDAEGADYCILTQMDLRLLGCEMLLVETNHKENEKYIEYCARFGMRLYKHLDENLIFVK